MNGFQIAVLRMLAWLIMHTAQVHRKGSVEAGFIQKGISLAGQATMDCDQAELATKRMPSFKERVREVQETLNTIMAEVVSIPEDQAHIEEAISHLDQAIQNEPY